MVEYVRGHYGLPLRRACRLVRLHRSVFKYKSALNPRLELRERMRELARVRVRFGYRKLHVLLRREGFGMSRDVTYRVYTEEGLQLRSKLPRRRKMSVTRRERYIARQTNQAWSMDFVADQLVNGNRFRARVFVDNGSEFSGRLFDLWAYHHGVQVDFSRPGKPTDNCFIETFNGSLRDDCLNVHWFESLEEAKEKIEAWRRDYNESRPHQALREQTPLEFAAQARNLERSMGLQIAGNSL